LDQIQRLEGELGSNPDDGLAFRRLVNALARSGRLYDARNRLRARIASAKFSLHDLNEYLHLGRQAGFVSQTELQPCQLMNFQAIFHGKQSSQSEIEIVLGFASVAGAGSLVSIEALAALFGVRPRRHKATGEILCELRLELPEPLVVSPRFRVRAVRAITLPGSPYKHHFRHWCLRELNGLAFIADSRSDGKGETNEKVFASINRDLVETHGLGLNRFRFVIQYLEPPPPELHRALLMALGLSEMPRVYANVETTAARTHRPDPIFDEYRPGYDRVLEHEGVLDTFCLLLQRTVRDLQSL